MHPKSDLSLSLKIDCTSPRWWDFHQASVKTTAGLEPTGKVVGVQGNKAPLTANASKCILIAARGLERGSTQFPPDAPEHT